MKKYHQYRDSLITWIGEIPAHWEVVQLRRVVVNVKTGSTPKGVKDDHFNDTGLCWFTPSDFGEKFYLFNSEKHLSILGEKEVIVFPENSVLMIGIGGTMGKVALSKVRCSSNQQINVIVPNEKIINNIFLVFYLKAMRNNVFNTAKFTTLPILNQLETKKIYLPLPPAAEQAQIVKYLDGKTQLIDKFIAEKEREIGLLLELKQAEIARAVTQGLNPKVKMKNSAIAWLGDIPAHWEIVRCKDIMKPIDKRVGQNQNLTLLSLTKNGVVIRDISEGKGKFPKDYETYKIIEPNNLICCLFDVEETPRTIGIAYNHGMITGAYNVFDIVNAKLEFIYFYFLSLDDRKALQPLYKGLRKTIPLPSLLGSKIPLPPLSEQEAIVSYINGKVLKIEEYISLLRSELVSLKEYKQVLVSDVVCGRRCVLRAAEGK